jgi:hypothetical protein
MVRVVLGVAVMVRVVLGVADMVRELLGVADMVRELLGVADMVRELLGVAVMVLVLLVEALGVLLLLGTGGHVVHDTLLPQLFEKLDHGYITLELSVDTSRAGLACARLHNEQKSHTAVST